MILFRKGSEKISQSWRRAFDGVDVNCPGYLCDGATIFVERYRINPGGNVEGQIHCDHCSFDDFIWLMDYEQERS